MSSIRPGWIRPSRTRASRVRRAISRRIGLKQEMVMASVKAEMEEEVVIDTIAQLENLTVEEADREAYAEENGSDVETMVGIYGEETFNEQVQRSKVMKFLADNAVAEELPLTDEAESEAATASNAEEETEGTTEE